MSSQPVVETVELTKTYGDITAVERLNLRIGEGEIFGFLGPNGAGKTTTILMLLGLTEPTSGEARVWGFNSTREPLKVKRIAGYLPENVGFYEDLTAEQNLRYTARLNRLSNEQASRRIGELLEVVGLAEVADQRVGEFSKGMKQRLGIADVLVKDPKIVFLDEPTMGIDPDGANHILDLIVSMSKDQRITVVLSSHLLQQVQRICHRVGILVKGHMVAEGPIERLGREAVGGEQITIEVQASDPATQVIDSIGKVEGVKNIERSGDLLLVTCDKDTRLQISRAIVESKSSVLYMKIQDYALEEIYMRYFREE